MKQIVDYEELVRKIKGTSVPKPLSGTLSGHAAGEPFDKHVYKEIKKQFPKNTFRQYEYLNDLYLLNPKVIGFKARQNLFNSPTVMFLLNRGKVSTDKWSMESPFDEKQDDTADILVVNESFYEIIDIKTRNISKSSRPPNIISSFKLAQACAIMIDNQEFNSFTIDYFEIDWLLENGNLVCKEAHYASLFKANDFSQLYINWSAGMQIQFHVCDLTQDFTGTTEEWAKAYLKHFIESAKNRTKYMIAKYVKPFEKYLDK